MTEYLTVGEAAAKVRASKSLIQARCKDGTLPAIRVGKAYRILATDLEQWTQHSPTRGPASPVSYSGDVSAAIAGWYTYMVAVKNYSPDTIIGLQKHFRVYLRRLAASGRSCSEISTLFKRESMTVVLASMGELKHSSKLSAYCSLVYFGRYLVENKQLNQSLLDDLKTLKPRQRTEPRRTSLKASDVGRFFETVLTRKSDSANNLTVAAMAGCMVYAGLRASEVCSLAVSDIDMVNNTISVRLGKGGKSRRVGISRALRPLLSVYLKVRPPIGSVFFVDADGTTYHRNKIGKRIKHVSQRMGVDITCHGLRRTFATLLANQGRSVNSIRIALGHSNLSTTQMYLRTSEAEVVEQMKGW